MEVKFANLDTQEVRVINGEMRLFEGDNQIGAGVPISEGPFRISVRKVTGNYWFYYSDNAMADGPRYYSVYDTKLTGAGGSAGSFKIKKMNIEEGPSGKYCSGPIMVGSIEDIVRYGNPDDPAGLLHATDLYKEGDNNYYAELSMDTYDENATVVRLAITAALKRYVRIILL